MYKDTIVGRAALMLSPHESRKMIEIDSQICALAADDTPETWIVPSLISGHTLQRSGHLDFFLHQITRVATGLPTVGREIGPV